MVASGAQHAFQVEVGPHAQQALARLPAELRELVLARAKALASLAARAPVLFGSFPHAPLCFTIETYRVTYAIRDAERVLELRQVVREAAAGGEQAG